MIQSHDILHKLEYITDDQFLSNLRKAISQYPDAYWDDALSWGQLQSKKWLVAELTKINPKMTTMFILGGWLGTLPAMLFRSNLDIGVIRSFDIDPECAVIAEAVNKIPYVVNGWRFKASTGDMFNIDYTGHKYDTKRSDGSVVTLHERPDVIVNTSCEHIDVATWWNMIPSGTLCVIQSNNLFGGRDHINCVNSIGEFKAMAPMTNVMFEGDKYISTANYTRFMMIGIK